MSTHEAETYNRTAKILVDGGMSDTLQGALDTLDSFAIVLAVGDDATSASHHIALLTAATCAVRAVGRVECVLGANGDQPCAVRWHQGASLREALVAIGVHVVDKAQRTVSAPTLAIGSSDLGAEVSLQITWQGWTAHVRPDSRRWAEDADMPLAPAAAAALAVAEAFGSLSGRSSAGHRPRQLSLWEPGSAQAADDGPALRWLPDGYWLVGLGHLGQGYAWCLGLLPHAAGTARVFLQDVDKVNEANRSTGILVGVAHVTRLKTRVLSEALEAVGFHTRLVERRFEPGQRRLTGEPSIALFGVDNVTARRAISDAQFPLAVDAGLGSGAVDYCSIAIKSFPASGDSAQVAAWATGPTERGTSAASGAAYQQALSEGADACGLVLLAGRAAAASFVGIIAATLALAEPLRILHSGQHLATASFDAGRPRPARSSPATTAPRLPFVDTAQPDA